MEGVPGQAEKSSQQVWIRSTDTTKLSPTAGIPGSSGVRRLLKVLKCKPGSQVSRSGSGSAGYISRHRHVNTVAQPAAKDKSLSSNFSAKEGGRQLLLTAVWAEVVQLCHISTPAQVIEFKEENVYLGPEEITRNYKYICCILLLYLWAGGMENRYWFYLMDSWEK